MKGVTKTTSGEHDKQCEKKGFGYAPISTNGFWHNGLANEELAVVPKAVHRKQKINMRIAFESKKSNAFCFKFNRFTVCWC